MKAQKYIAELLGTFVLALAVLIASMQDSLLSSVVVAGLTLGLFVYTIGGISGAHLNPAVTISLATVKKISWKETVWYVLFQLIGGLLAMFFFRLLTDLPLDFSFEDFPFELDVGKTFVSEAIGTFMLVFGVSAVVLEKVYKDASGAVIGGSFFLGVVLAGGIGGMSLAFLNPAIALSNGLSLPGLPIHFIAPVVGGIIAANVFKWLAK